MNFDLSEEQQDIQRLARDFAHKEVAPVAEELDREKRFPYEIVQKLGIPALEEEFTAAIEAELLAGASA